MGVIHCSGVLAEFAFHLKREGYKPSTIESNVKALKMLARLLENLPLSAITSLGGLRATTPQDQLGKPSTLRKLCSMTGQIICPACDAEFESHFELMSHDCPDRLEFIITDPETRIVFNP
jgi:hypothetical protein